MRNLLLLLLLSTTAFAADGPRQRDDTRNAGGRARGAPHIAAMLRDRAGDRLARIVILRPAAENQLDGNVRVYEWESGASDVIATGRMASSSSELHVDVAAGTFAFTRKPVTARSTAVIPIDGEQPDGNGQMYFLQGSLVAKTPKGYSGGGLAYYASWYECPTGLKGSHHFQANCSQAAPTNQVGGEILVLRSCTGTPPSPAPVNASQELFLGRVVGQYDGLRSLFLIDPNIPIHETLQGEGWASGQAMAYIRWSYAHQDPDGFTWPAPIHWSASGNVSSYPTCPSSGGGGYGDGGSGGGPSDPGSTPDPYPSDGGGGSDPTGCVSIHDGVTQGVIGVCCGTTTEIVECAGNL